MMWGRVSEFAKRNVVMIVMLPVLAGLHIGWLRVQDTEAFVPKKDKMELPVTKVASRLKEEITNKIQGNVKEE